MVTLDLTSYRRCLCCNVGEYEAKGIHSVNKICFYVSFRRCLDDFFLFLCTYRVFLLFIIYLYQQMQIYIKILNYIANAPTCFDDFAPSSGNINIAIAKVIKY
jgi:hypothetical protein